MGVVPASIAGEGFRHAGPDCLDVLGDFDTGFDRAGLVVFLAPVVVGVGHILVAALVHGSDHLDADTVDLGRNADPREAESVAVRMDDC